MLLLIWYRFWGYNNIFNPFLFFSLSEIVGFIVLFKKCLFILVYSGSCGRAFLGSSYIITTLGRPKKSIFRTVKDNMENIYFFIIHFTSIGRTKNSVHAQSKFESSKWLLTRGIYYGCLEILKNS